MTTQMAELDRALELHESGRLDEAEALYRQVLMRAPRNAEALHLLGVVRHQRGKHDEAADLIRQAIAVNGSDPRYHNSLGIACRAAGKFVEAEASYRRVLELDPRFAEAASNLGNVLHQQGKIDAALEFYRRALALDPNRAPFHNNLGTALFDLGDGAGAERCFRQALALHPGYPDAHFNRALVLLQRGAYEEGWREYEWRWRMASFGTKRRDFTAPQWHGEKLDGARIFIHSEQGFGDMLQFVRYAPLVAARGGAVVLEAPPELMRLFRGVAGVAELVARGPNPPSSAWHCPLLSLPLAFGTTLATVPAAVPYLSVDAAAAARWRERLAARAGRRVGVMLAGRTSWKAHYRRSIPADRLAAFAAVPGVALFSLQKDPPLGADNPYNVTDLAPWLTDFAETAAAIAALELVVTVDSAVAHLAGALGKPVWIMLPHVADWRWLVGRDDSPWYPTARLFRQETAGDWDEVVARVAASLRRDGRGAGV